MGTARPHFSWKMSSGSQKQKQNSGTRQVWPFSPYLFVLVMTCIEPDITREISKKVVDARIPGTTFDMVFYADDTIVVSRAKEACEELLEKIGRISGQYGLKLNKDRYVNLNISTDEQQTLSGGECLMKAQEANYLGNTLNSKANATTEVEKQIQQTKITMWKLNSYGKATEASKKCQILIFDAVIKSKLLYAIETVQLDALINNLDAF